MAVWEVGTSKAYSTPKEAYDALFATVGTTPFTETHTIRFFDGTGPDDPLYNEGTVVPTSTYRLVTETAAGNSVVIRYINWSGISHTTIRNVTTSYGFTIQGDTNDHIWYNNILYGASMSAAMGINAQSSDLNILVYNNLFYSNSSQAISTSSCNNVEIYNNTFYNNGTSLAIGGGSNNVTIKNNTIWNLSGRCIHMEAANTGFVCNYNNFYITDSGVIGDVDYGTDIVTIADWRTASSQDANSISADAIFANAGGTTANDYIIASNSPCKATGTNLSGTFTTDYFGDTRPTLWSMGLDDFPVTTAIKRVCGVPQASIKRINGVPIASVKKFMGVA